MTEKEKDYLMAVQGYIILIKKPGDNVLYGPVENSFSLSVEANRTYFNWTSEKIGIDGWTHVNKDWKYWKERHPEWELTIYNARDEQSLPVVINWELWLDAHEPSDKTLSGIKNKHEARNLRFTLKGDPIDTNTIAPCFDYEDNFNTNLDTE